MGKNIQNKGIFNIRKEEMNEYDMYFYKQYIKEDEKELKRYMINLLSDKARQNTLEINPLILSNKEMLIQKETIKNKYVKIKNVILGNIIGTYFWKENKIEMYLSNIYKYLYYHSTVDAEFLIIRIIYHELQHQLQYEFFKDDLLMKEMKILEDNYKFYIKYHDYFELEIDAEINSLKRLKQDIIKGEYPFFNDQIYNINNRIEMQKRLRLSPNYEIVKEEIKKI